MQCPTGGWPPARCDLTVCPARASLCTPGFSAEGGRGARRPDEKGYYPRHRGTTRSEQSPASPHLAPELRRRPPTEIAKRVDGAYPGLPHAGEGVRWLVTPGAQAVARDCRVARSREAAASEYCAKHSFRHAADPTLGRGGPRSQRQRCWLRVPG